VLTLSGMLASFIIIYAMPFAENAAAQNQPLQIGELFVALTNWRFTMLLFSSLALLWYGDLPILEPFAANALLRGSRRTWIFGQVFYVFMSSLLLCAFILLVTIFIAFPNINLTNEWSRPVKLLTTSGRIAVSPERMRLPMPKELVNAFTPWSALTNSMILFFLMSFVYGIATIALKLRFRSGGFIFLLLVNAASWSIGMFSVGEKGYAYLSMISLHYHVTLYVHSYNAVNPLLPTLMVSYVILTGLCLAILALLTAQVKRYDFVAMEVH
jgi:hypothetical protein